MNEKINLGASIIINNWLHLKDFDKLLIITNSQYEKEALALKHNACNIGAKVDILTVENLGSKVGVYFDEHEDAFDNYTAIIGATEYSIVTTKATKKAISLGNKFLSLPLSTSNGVSMLAFDFIKLDTKKSKLFASIVREFFNQASVIRVETEQGTSLTMSMKGRKAGFFNGDVRDGDGYSSASVELYVPIVEDMTNGVMVVDGSLGYIGKADIPTKVFLKDGKIISIEQTETGIKLDEYIKTYNDDRVYFACEFGLGLNSLSKCDGNCYIEDESAYGTFHIGFGRNLALGGNHEASGHYDLVCLKPDVFIDNRMIMQKGKLIVAQPDIY